MKKQIVVIMLGLSFVGGIFTSTVSAQNSIISNINRGVDAVTGGTQAPAATTPMPSQTTTTPSNNGSGGTYAALGDSVAAGLGLPPVANATAQDTQCGRSSQAYPYMVAQQRQLRLIHVACSGATIGDLVTNQGVSGPNLQPQLDAAYANGTPQLITITAGANDVHWTDFLRLCYSFNCATTINSTVARGYTLVAGAKLDYAFQDIANRSNGHPPTVIITGYYNPVSNYCSGRQSNVTADEINWLNTQRDALNKTIRDTAARYSFVKYASADFTGHGLCSSDPWTQGLNDPAPLHPTAAGQAQIAQSILGTL